VIVLPIEREPGDDEEVPAGGSEDAEKERPVSPNAPSDDSKGDTNKHKKHLVRRHKYMSISVFLSFMSSNVISNCMILYEIC
jgi:hypothetical protein